MARIVNGRVVEEQQVLVRPSASNVETTVALTSGLNARQHLDGLEHIDFPHKRGQSLNGCHGHFCFPQVGAQGVLPIGTHHFDCIDFDRLSLQFNVPFRVPVAVKVF